MTDGGRRGKVSAGLLMYRECGAPADAIEVFLVHPGGPFFRNRDEGAWTIPKGGIEAGESPLAAAEREFREETGFTPAGPYLELTPVQQRGHSIENVFGLTLNGSQSPRNAQAITVLPPRCCTGVSSR